MGETDPGWHQVHMVHVVDKLSGRFLTFVGIIETPIKSDKN